jgi:phosphoglycolate phosphatase
MELKSDSQIKGIIWDWNGTLLNDTNLAVESMNGILSKRGLPVLTIDRYKNVFTFPVKDYYQLIGFDFGKEPFEIPALEFIDRYNLMVRDCSLHENTIEVLSFFKNCGMRQYILSAMMQETLDQCLEHYKITHFFEQVSGLDDHYANSKLETGRLMLGKLRYKPGELILIGDTVHDFDVATELGCACILVSNGHQSNKRLNRTGAMVIDDLSELMDHRFLCKA